MSKQKEMFPKVCEECGKEKSKLIKCRGKEVCLGCWYKILFEKKGENS